MNIPKDEIQLNFIWQREKKNEIYNASYESHIR